jgi:hypothetical protein
MSDYYPCFIDMAEAQRSQKHELGCPCIPYVIFRGKDGQKMEEIVRWGHLNVICYVQFSFVRYQLKIN